LTAFLSHQNPQSLRQKLEPAPEIKAIAASGTFRLPLPALFLELNRELHCS